MTPSEKIQICLEMKNLKRRDLAKASDMSPSSVSDFLNGKTTKLDITKAQSIANTLGCTLNYLVGDDTMDIDVSEALKAEREEQHMTTQELAAETHIPELWILKFESGTEKISSFLFEKICNAFGMTTFDFLTKYELYDEYIPPEFNGDVNAYEAFKKALLEDQARASAKYPELKDIIEKGLYVVNGFPARRSFRMTLEPYVNEIYKHPWSVWINTEGKIENTIAEYIEVAKQFMDDPDKIKRLDDEFKARKNDNPDELFDWAYKSYSDTVFSSNWVRTYRKKFFSDD